MCEINLKHYTECLEEFTEQIIVQDLFESVIKSVAFSNNQAKIILDWLELNQSKLCSAFLLVRKERDLALQKAKHMNFAESFSMEKLKI